MGTILSTPFSRWTAGLYTQSAPVSVVDGITWRDIQKLKQDTAHPLWKETEVNGISMAYIHFLNDRYHSKSSGPRNLEHVIQYQSSDVDVDNPKTPFNLHTCGNGFYSAFERAWATHGGVIISPDDIWMAIQLQFCQYMDKNAEELRDVFVSHSGKQELKVDMTGVGMNWSVFMQRMGDEIKGKTKVDTDKSFLPQFSTSSKLDGTLKRLALMDCMQQYFSYTMSSLCGIEKVGFEGTLDDWTLLRSTVEGLAQFSVPSKVPSKYFSDLKVWVKELLYVIDNFIATYTGAPVPVEFWNSCINIHRTYGSGASTYLKGWMTLFLQGGDCHDWREVEMTVSSIPDHRLNVPVTVQGFSESDFNVRVLGGFTGVEHDKGANIYRAQKSLVVVKVAADEEPEQQF